jgi:hypothetical protein
LDLCDQLLFGLRVVILVHLVGGTP